MVCLDGACAGLQRGRVSVGDITDGVCELW